MASGAVGKKPGAIGAPPAEIICSVIWRSITRINVVDQTFDAEVDIKATAPNGVNTLDPSFKGPKLFVTNAVTAVPMNTPAWVAKPNGDMVEEYQIRGTFTSHFDMQNFPLDVQELSVHIQCDTAVLVPGPNVRTKQGVRLVVSDTDDPIPCTVIELGATIAPMLWRLQSMQIQAGHSPADDSSRGNVYSRIHSSIVVERQPGFFWWNAVCPTFLFTSLAFLSMVVHPENLADRLAVTISLILTGGAYKIVAASAVPEISYLTLLDQYVVGSLIISSLIAVQNASGHLSDTDGIDEELDLRCGQALLAVWAAFNLFFALRWTYVRRFCQALIAPVQMLRTDSIPYLSTDPEMKSVPQWKRTFASAPKRATGSAANTFFAVDSDANVATNRVHPSGGAGASSGFAF